MSARQHRKDTSDRWYHPHFSLGYCQPIRGYVYTIVAGVKRSTGMTWTPANKREALALLEQHIRAHRQGALPASVVRQPLNEATLGSTPATVYGVIKGFLDAHASTLTPNAMRMMERSVRCYFPADMTADVDALADHLALTTAQTKLQKYTISKYLSRIKRIMRYAVGRGWLSRDPTLAVASLPYEATTDPDILLEAEVEAIVGAVRGLPILGQRTPATLEQAALALTFLYLTGMRISEALRLHWADITTERILVHGKGQRLREFPLAAFPSVAECLDKIRALGLGEPDGRVFTWTTYVHLGDVMREATSVAFKKNPRRASAISGRLHVLRASAEWRWENDLGIDFVTICDLAGHSLAVRERHYRKRHKPAHLLADRIMGTGNAQADPIAR